VIYNPAAGQSGRREEAVRSLSAHAARSGLTVTAVPTAGPGDAVRLAAGLAASGVPLVVAYGGDGTVNEVLQGLAGSGAVLGVWPGGTANLLAHELRMPEQPDRMARLMASGQTRRVSLGQSGDRYFLLMAGVGFDAAVVAGVRASLKRKVGKGAFLLAALEQFGTWQPHDVTVEWEDGEQTAGSFAVIGNTYSYGGGFRFTPRARLEEPWLEVCLFRGERRLDFLRYLVPSWLGRHTDLPDVLCRKATAVRLTGSAPVQADGELVGSLPMQFRVVPNALDVLVSG
jgi:diacylglycerol kinase (ATP)